MTRFVFPLVLGAIAAVGFPAGAAEMKLCGQRDGAPTGACVEMMEGAMQFRGGLRDVDIVAEIPAADIGMLADLEAPGGRFERMEICIVNGANICPPEPFEIVWVCITTGMLAGTECPEPPETDGTSALVKLATRP